MSIAGWAGRGHRHLHVARPGPRGRARGHRGRAGQPGRAAHHDHHARRRTSSRCARGADRGRARARRSARPRPAPGAPRGMPISTTSHRAGVLLARARRAGRAWSRGRWRWRRALTASPSTSPVEAFDAGGHVAGHHRARPAALIAAIARASGSRGAPSKPVPSRASTTTPEPSRRSGSNGSGGAPGRRSRLARASPRSSSSGRGREHVDLVAVLAQQPRRHQAVAAVVALADHDPHRPGPRRRGGDPREPGARALHQVERRHALLLDRPGVDGAHLGGLVERVEPVGQAHPGERPTRPTAPAVVPVWVSEIETSPPSSAARSADAPAQPHLRRGLGGDHLHVAEAPAGQPERLRHRLLGAEARGQVHARAAPALPRSRARHP